MSQVNLEVKVGNKVARVPIEAVKIVNKVNQIPFAELTLAQDSLALNSTEPIKFTLNKQTFVGVISEKLKVFSQGRVSYKVRLAHPVEEMTRSRRSRVFETKAESSLLQDTFKQQYQNIYTKNHIHIYE